MRSALVNLGTGLVENLIVADPAIDAAPDGYCLVAEPPAFVTLGSPWNGVAWVDTAPQPPKIDGLETL